MWEGCSTLICWRSAAGGRRNRKGSDQLFLSQGTPSTPPPPTSLPPLTMAGSTTVTTGYFKDLNFVISSQHTAHNTLQLLCILLAPISHAEQASRKDCSTAGHGEWIRRPPKAVFILAFEWAIERDGKAEKLSSLLSHPWLGSSACFA